MAFVHPGTELRAARLMEAFGLQDLPRVADPDGALYRAFGLARGSWLQIAGPRVWWQGLRTLFRGHLPARPGGDVRLMPGVFVVHDGVLRWSFRHGTTGDRPDYEACLDAAARAGRRDRSAG